MISAVSILVVMVGVRSIIAFYFLPLLLPVFGAIYHPSLSSHPPQNPYASQSIAIQRIILPGVHEKVLQTAFGSAYHGERRQQQAQRPSAGATHHRGQDESVAPAKPAAPTRSADAPLATTRATIALSFVRPRTNRAAPACASSSDSSARRASQGNACRASRSNERCLCLPRQCRLKPWYRHL